MNGIAMIFLFCINNAYSQNEATGKRFFRLSVDNDALILSNNATDWGYTSGISIDFFYSAVKNRSDFFNWVNNLAGPNRVTTKRLALTQLIMAPQETSLTIPARNDYSYAGALLALYSIHSANPLKKINLQSEWIIGLMGPLSFAQQTQNAFHRLIKDPLPMGWNYQLPTDLLVNYNVMAEKLILDNRFIGLVGGGELLLGSLTDGVSTHLLLQIGKNRRNYFSGLNRQYFAEKKPNFSFLVKASTNLVFYNALLQGGLFNSQSPVYQKHSVYGTGLSRQKITGSLELKILVSTRKFTATFSQKITSTEFKGYGPHCVGNISVFKTL
ncbi:MAG: lipid A deacylase LpxR family protein [Chitinophagaceae bacterium]|nr:lipid A deacylase LpxR family protein [Chitinophagaceae bacterium]